jgi:hypothetical protein
MRFAFLLACLGACYGRGAGSAPPPTPPPSTSFSCFTMTSGATHGSFCYADPGRCDGERTAAEGDGAATNACYRQSPVACFQLRGDPRPEMEMCAAALADCDLLRTIDRDKSGTTSPACEWRHGR